MENRELIVPLYLKNGRAVRSLRDSTETGDAAGIAASCGNCGADALLLFDLSDGDAEHDAAIRLIRQIGRAADIPLYGGGNIRRLEDVKKLIYAGCRKVFLNYARVGNRELTQEASARFGRDRLLACVRTEEELQEAYAQSRLLDGVVLLDASLLKEAAKAEPGAADGGKPYGWGHIFCVAGSGAEATADAGQNGEADFRCAAASAGRESAQDGRRSGAESAPAVPSVAAESAQKGRPDETEFMRAAFSGGADGIFCREFALPGYDFMEAKHMLLAAGIPVNTFESSLEWSDLRPNSDGLVPVVVQDYRTDEVLMVAYMNEEAFRSTVRTGRMTYFSRSRQTLWLKGETSGHFQYLRELRVDCDNDTLLAKIVQIGAACHTGNLSCFYRSILRREYNAANPLKIFESVFAVIQDRKIHPKEGSYTNYLFEKGIDKILKKVGEEATEIVIAAKNPDPDEIVYEISDFLYHVMVLMAERGLTWEDVTEELTKRIG